MAILMRTLEEIGAAVRAARLARGWTQVELAEAASSLGFDVGDKLVSKVERGNNCELKYMLALLNALDLDLDLKSPGTVSKATEEALRGLPDQHHAIVARFARVVPHLDEEHRDLLIREMKLWERQYIKGEAERT